MFKSTYNTIIILFLVLRVQAQQIIYQPLIFNNIEPVWQHAPIDSSLIGINNFDGRNHFTISKNPSCYVLFEDNLYIAPSTATTEFGVDGGFIERINTITGEVDWINTFDLRSEERQEFIQDLYIDDQRRVNVVSFRRIVEPIPDPYFVWIENGDSSIISIRKYDIETGELLEHKTPDFTDYQSLRLRHQVNNARFFKGDKKGNFQYIEKEKKSGFVLKQYYLDENGYQIGQMNQDSMVFSNPNSWSSNSILPILVVNKDTIVALSFLIRQSSTESGQSRLTIYDQNLKKRHEFFLDDLIEDNYKSLLLNYADKDFIYLQVVYWLGPTEEVYNEHIIMDYEGKIIKRFETIQDGLYYFPFIITYLEKENEFLIVGLIRDRTFGLTFFKTKGFDELGKIKTISYQNPEYFFNVSGVSQQANGDILLHGINIYWPINEQYYQATWPTWLRFNAEDIGLTSSKETDIVSLLRIYPNPASDRITVSLEEDQSGVIDILDHMGREVYVTDNEANEGLNHIDIGFLPTGMYIVRVTDKTGRINGTGRFVKMN